MLLPRQFSSVVRKDANLCRSNSLDSRARNEAEIRCQNFVGKGRPSHIPHQRADQQKKPSSIFQTLQIEQSSEKYNHPIANGGFSSSSTTGGGGSSGIDQPMPAGGAGDDPFDRLFKKSAAASDVASRTNIQNSDFGGSDNNMANSQAYFCALFLVKSIKLG